MFPLSYYWAACASFDDDALVFLSDYYDYITPILNNIFYCIFLLFSLLLCYVLGSTITFFCGLKNKMFIFFLYFGRNYN